MPALQPAVMRSVGTFALPPAYRAAEVLAYHGRDAASRSERVVGDRILKPLWLAGGPALVAITVLDDHVQVSADRSLDRTESAALEVIARRILGLTGGDGALAACPAAAVLVSARPGLRLPLTASPWEALCWAVIGQQINLTFAAALRRELVDLAGPMLGATDWRLHPGPEAVAALSVEALTARRFSRSKAAYLIGAARAVRDGTLDLDGLAALQPEAAEAALVSIHGIGRWTARYVMLRGLGFGDVAPVGDSGLATALQRLYGLAERPDMAAQERLMAAFAPHRSLATAHLWASLAAPVAPHDGAAARGRV